MRMNRWVWKVALLGGLVVFNQSVLAALSDESAFLKAEVYQAQKPGLNLGVGPGVAVLGNEVGWGLNLTLDRKMSDEHPFYVGLDFGAHQWTGITNPGPFNRFRAKSYDSEIVSIQLLSSFYYRFYIPMLSMVYPYLGLSLGPNIVLAKGNVVQGATGDSKVWIHESNVYAEVLFRPGFTVTISRAFGINIEPKFGWLGTSFVFLPQFSASVIL